MHKPVGIYVHIPFCASKCVYCNFYSVAGSDRLMHDYQDAVIKHIAEYLPQLDGYLIDTVYFGGGTPGYYGADRLTDIFNTLKKYGHVLPGSEVTAEINPGDMTKKDLVKLKRAGFNRLSIGVQCADDETLKSLGRLHTFADAEETVRNARLAEFNNISVDIIYGLPSQDKNSWAETIARTASLKTEHISCCRLKIGKGAQLYIFRDSPFIPDDDVQADMYLYTVETFARYGYKQYEVSNFARRGYESAHCMKYWLGGEYIGFGSGAHSYINRRRFSFIDDIWIYIEGVTIGQVVTRYSAKMSVLENGGEYLMLRLRTIHGISEEEYYSISGLKMDHILELLRKYELSGWALYMDGRWRFTPKGFLFSKTLIGELLDAQSRQLSQSKQP